MHMSGLGKMAFTVNITHVALTGYTFAVSFAMNERFFVAKTL